MSRLRRAQAGALPRWVTAPVWADWLDPRTYWRLWESKGALARMALLELYHEGLEMTYGDGQWQDLAAGYPKLHTEIDGDQPTGDRPPQDLIWQVRARSDSLPRWLGDDNSAIPGSAGTRNSGGPEIAPGNGGNGAGMAPGGPPAV